MALLSPSRLAPHTICTPSFARPHLQGVCDASRLLCRIVKPGAPQSPAHPRMMWVAHALSQTGGQSFWKVLFRQRIRYSTDPGDVDVIQLSELWAKTLNVDRNPLEIAKALKHSYSIIVALDQGEGKELSEQRLVGFGRAVSDGAFIATICDVAVDPAYQRRGIGRTLVKELVKNMKQRDGPTGFAVFPPPKTRLFFWRIGFRSDKTYRFMTYRGRLLESRVQDEEDLHPE